MMKQIRHLNPNRTIHLITDKCFEKYGRVVEDNSFLNAVAFLDKHTLIPEIGNHYVADDRQFFETITDRSAFDDLFGYVDLEFGYVNGKNSLLNAVEYHNSLEVNIAATPMVISVGSFSDIVNQHYDSNNLEFFYVPKDTTFFIFPKVLHFSPYRVLESGFKCGVILPYKTNMNFVKSKETKTMEDRFLFKTNKWLLAHNEHEAAKKNGAFVGLIGENIEINCIRGKL